MVEGNAICNLLNGFMQRKLFFINRTTVYPLLLKNINRYLLDNLLRRAIIE